MARERKKKHPVTTEAPRRAELPQLVWSLSVREKKGKSFSRSQCLSTSFRETLISPGRLLLGKHSLAMGGCRLQGPEMGYSLTCKYLYKHLVNSKSKVVLKQRQRIPGEEELIR